MQMSRLRGIEFFLPITPEIYIHLLVLAIFGQESNLH